MCALTPKSLLSLSFHSTPEAVRETLARIVDVAVATGQNPTATNNIELAMAEALNNVVEHSFRDRSNGRIQLSVTLVEDSYRVSIRHDGTPLPRLQMPEGKPANLDVDTADLPEGGFGWFLIHSLVTEATYTHREDWNELVLRFARYPKP